MIAATKKEQEEFAEFPKLIKKTKTQDIPACNMASIEEALRSGALLKSIKKRVGIGTDALYVLSDEKLRWQTQ